MAFLVEDGTGLAAANSFCAVATADTLWTDRGGHAGWTAATNGQKEAALVRASDYIRNQRRFRWIGTRKTYAQALPWPRTGAVERDGVAVPETVVPWQLALATALLAARALTEDLLPDLERGGHIRSESVGPLSVSYADDAPLGTVIQSVDGLVAPLLRMPLTEAAGTLALPDIPAGYVEGEFEYQ